MPYPAKAASAPLRFLQNIFPILPQKAPVPQCCNAADRRELIPSMIAVVGEPVGFSRSQKLNLVIAGTDSPTRSTGITTFVHWLLATPADDPFAFKQDHF